MVVSLRSTLSSATGLPPTGICKDQQFSGLFRCLQRNARMSAYGYEQTLGRSRRGVCFLLVSGHARREIGKLRVLRLLSARKRTYATRVLEFRHCTSANRSKADPGDNDTHRSHNLTEATFP